MPWFGGWQDGGENLGDFKTLNKNGKEDPEEGASRRGLLLFSQEKEGGTFIQGKKDQEEIVPRKKDKRIYS